MGGRAPGVPPLDPPMETESANQTAVHLRPISNFTENLTFDSNSTSD